MSEHLHHEVLTQGALVMFFMLLFYMSLGTFIEKHHLKFGHEAAYTIILGIFISLGMMQSGNKHFVDMIEFSDNTFFYFLLPPIVFASGFNMQRGNFFANIKNVMLFGVFGTFVAFFSFSGMTMVMNSWDWMQQYDGATGEWSPLKLTNQEILLFCSLLSSSDVIAAVSLISYENEPNLYAIVFGEGITNDAVSIILFNTVMRYTARKDVKLTWVSPIQIISEFVILGLNSLIIGVFFAMLSSWVLKYFRSISKNVVSECLVVFCTGYISYVVAELTHQSGIITLLTCAIVMAHYSWYNLSPQGKQSSYVVFQFIGYAAEAYVFAYLGVTFFSYAEYKWSPHLFWGELLIIMIGRIFGTVGLVAAVKLCGYDAKIPLNKQIFIWYAGMIRGAIAFGLVLRIDQAYENRGVIVTSSLLLVVFTTVVNGSTVGLLQICLMGSPEENESPKAVTEGEADKKETDAHLIEKLDGDESYEESGEDSYEEMDHPNIKNNDENMKAHLAKRRYTGCLKYLKRFDELVIKPWFIYKYEKSMQKKAKELFNVMMKQGQEIEQHYQKSSGNKTAAIAAGVDNAKNHTIQS